MADSNDVTIRRANVGWGYEVFIGDVRIRHIKDLSIRMNSSSTLLAEFTITFVGKLSHAAGVVDQALENISDGIHSANPATTDVANNDDKD